MTRERAKELLPIIQAYAEGKTIECFTIEGRWQEITNPFFDSATKYRIKPKPMERWWVMDAEGHVCLSSDNEKSAREWTDSRTSNNYRIVHFREVVE